MDTFDYVAATKFMYKFLYFLCFFCGLMICMLGPMTFRWMRRLQYKIMLKLRPPRPGELARAETRALRWKNRYFKLKREYDAYRLKDRKAKAR